MGDTLPPLPNPVRDDLVWLLDKTWQRVEAPHSVSYVATFRDMADDVMASDWLADIKAEVRRETLREVLDLLLEAESALSDNATTDTTTTPCSRPGCPVCTAREALT